MRGWWLRWLRRLWWNLEDHVQAYRIGREIQKSWAVDEKQEQKV